ncbi:MULTISPECIES: RNA ligase RtcB family protein [Vitreoscilla]|uniref:3'-phosphate/5'-hydroxy nucleic acid ligase n=1 Tax=Vitreoscilla stercoraria TaxID=61 RepID=A0ABY4EJH0_VITST|nr:MULTISPECIES: RNA ligase RtcB family protein [Vitreoscilla]AUZ05128.2 tRNA-splicing ligase RtcB [Vitreoscilla sp. C1]UOO93522.1 RNA ligase RtcB family protein [Vitreoscilla stercoraria]
MGNFSQHTHINIIANQNVWLEDSAIAQLQATAALAHIQAAVGLPDLHAGRGYPIGAAFFSTAHFYPALVGGDIGCGMALWQTDLKHHKISGSKLAKQLGNMDGVLPDNLLQDAANALGGLALQHLPLDFDSLHQSLGTIGGGNHFAELLQLDSLFVEQPHLDKSHLFLMVHSGSRGLGGEILRQHLNQFGHQGLAANSIEATKYWAQHNAALHYAHLNRLYIAKRMFKAWKTSASCVLDISHNHVVPFEWNGQAGFLHRKGAAPADQGWVMIPGSRGDYSYLVEPIGGEMALYSLAHGAGRKWARGDCQGRLAHKFKAQDLRQTQFGSTVVCGDKGLLYEEAPQAYKNIDAVIASLVDVGLCRLIARFKPVMTYKKGETPCC